MHVEDGSARATFVEEWEMDVLVGTLEVLAPRMTQAQHSRVASILRSATSKFSIHGSEGGGNLVRAMQVEEEEFSAALVTGWPSLPNEVLKHVITLAPVASLPVLAELERRTHPLAAERLASMKQLSLAQDSGLINDGCEQFDADQILGRVDMKASALQDPRVAPNAPHDPHWYLGADIYECSNEGMRAFAKALGDGAFPEVRNLSIIFTNLADSTLRQLIGPLSCGALPALVDFCLEANFASDPFMIQFSDAIATGALRALRMLNFSLNHIGDDGVTAFAGACLKGALPQLTQFQLRQNYPVGEPGIQALAAALSESALPSLSMLLLSPEWRNHVNLKPVCEKRAIRLHDRPNYPDA